jgi:hypothetical protein
MSGRKDTFLFIVVVLMFILAGYITDAMRRVNAKYTNGYQRTAEKMHQETGLRMDLQKNEFIRKSNTAVCTSNGVTVEGREEDRERVFSQYQRDHFDKVYTRSNNDLGDVRQNTESAADTTDRKIRHLQFQQSAQANEGLGKAMNNNGILAQEASGVTLSTQSTMLQDQAQMAHNLQNQHAKLNHSVVRSTNEALKEISRLELEKENARRQREAAMQVQENGASGTVIQRQDRPHIANMPLYIE